MVMAVEEPLDYRPLDHLMISEAAWSHVEDAGIVPRLVFAHPALLKANPRVSQYYRGIALLSQKRVSAIVGTVASWEDPSKTPRVTDEKSLEVARLYNAVISSIIDGATEWTVENGYRNVIANMGIGLDGTMRNQIGQDAEATIKSRIGRWLKGQDLIDRFDRNSSFYTLPGDYSMRFGSEPDIEFRKTDGSGSNVVATIEIKGGTDPAGALERLGAIQKSFEETPPGCVNMLVAGIITPEMKDRLDKLGIVRQFLLDDLSHDGAEWTEFVNELFHYVIRITPTPVTPFEDND